MKYLFAYIHIKHIINVCIYILYFFFYLIIYHTKYPLLFANLFYRNNLKLEESKFYLYLNKKTDICKHVYACYSSNNIQSK